MSTSLRLNIGCGDNKISGCINVDCASEVNPDVVCDIKSSNLPYDVESVDAIYFFHTIEHIEEIFHPKILAEFHRVLKPGAELIISYPEFTTCAQYYIDNYKGMRDFWRATIYGRQSRPGDYHVSLMDTRRFKGLLEYIGFEDLKIAPEPNENYNTIIKASRGKRMRNYEDIIREEIFS